MGNREVKGNGSWINPRAEVEVSRSFQSSTLGDAGECHCLGAPTVLGLHGIRLEISEGGHLRSDLDHIDDWPLLREFPSSSSVPVDLHDALCG